MTENAPESELRDRVEDVLRNVRDPEAGVDVFQAGIVDDIRIDGGDVTVEADLEAFTPAESDGVMSAMLQAIRTVGGVDHAHVEHAIPDTGDRSTGVDSIDRVIAVASAKGGVGKSTVAVNLASALAADERVGVFDADIYGPNVPSMFEVSGPIYSDDDGNPMPVDANGVEVISVGMMADDGPLAWRGSMAHDALTELFEDTAWQGRDTLVIDLPPGTGDITLTTLQEIRLDGVVFVTTPFHASVSDTKRSIGLFRENDIPVLGAVVNMGTFTCDACGEVHDLFPGGDPLADLDVPVLAELPFTADLQGTPDVGHPPETFANLAAVVRDRYEEIWTVDVPEDAVDLRGVPGGDRRGMVEEAFAALDPGETFYVVSDRDPSPVREVLADIVGRGDDPEAVFEKFAVKQQNPRTWLLRTRKPGE